MARRVKSQYAATFDSNCNGWSKSRKRNVFFLHMVQNYANDVMRSRYNVAPDGTVITRGYILLNEVRQMIGLPLVTEGVIVGWLYDEKNPVGDNFIDFDINPRGINPNVVIDFNVDGVVTDLLT